MAKKKAAAKKKPAPKAGSAARKIRKTDAKQKLASDSAKKADRKSTPKPAAVKKTASSGGPKRTAAERLLSAKRAKKLVSNARLMGPPRLPSDARLDFVFQKDYQAREVFHFLGVHTIRELEEFAPDDIIKRLTGPMVQTVERIRKVLAMSNRNLAKDRDFALKFKRQSER
ncbi:MAG: hypothetical protein AB7O38_19840 [Pirellulaceae bacterium]